MSTCAARHGACLIGSWSAQALLQQARSLRFAPRRLARGRACRVLCCAPAAPPSPTLCQECDEVGAKCGVALLPDAPVGEAAHAAPRQQGVVRCQGHQLEAAEQRVVADGVRQGGRIQHGALTVCRPGAGRVGRGCGLGCKGEGGEGLREVRPAERPLAEVPQTTEKTKKISSARRNRLKGREQQRGGRLGEGRWVHQASCRASLSQLTRSQLQVQCHRVTATTMAGRSPCTRFSALMKQKPSTPSCRQGTQAGKEGGGMRSGGARAGHALHLAW